MPVSGLPSSAYLPSIYFNPVFSPQKEMLSSLVPVLHLERLSGLSVSKEVTPVDAERSLLMNEMPSSL